MKFFTAVLASALFLAPAAMVAQTTTQRPHLGHMTITLTSARSINRIALRKASRAAS